MFRSDVGSRRVLTCRECDEEAWQLLINRLFFFFLKMSFTIRCFTTKNVKILRQIVYFIVKDFNISNEKRKKKEAHPISTAFSGEKSNSIATLIFIFRSSQRMESLNFKWHELWTEINVWRPIAEINERVFVLLFRLQLITKAQVLAAFYSVFHL